MPNVCIETKNETNRRYYARHRERLANEKVQYRKENPDKTAAAKQKYYAKNRDLIIAKSRAYEQKRGPRKVNKEARTNRNLQWNYGITTADYLTMLESQGGCCAICLTHQDQFKRKLSVDHDHSTGKIRALLCIKCNSLLGNSRDDTNLLTAAISYLEKHRGE